VLLGLSLIAGLGSAVLAVRNDVPRLAPWIVVLAAAALAIVILAIIHAWRRTDLEPRQKLLWTVAILLVSPVGAIVYFALGAGLTRDWWRRP
jgi:multisubunit Na+/H+ antiporter MnhB subunit